MSTFSNAECLELWEQGHGLHSLDQGLLLLGAEVGGVSFDALADWPLGRRNQALAALRCRSFGARLQAWTACPQCGERLEFELDGRRIASHAEQTGEGAPIQVNGRSYRVPTSRDLAQAAQESSSFAAAVRLVEACRLSAAELDGIEIESGGPVEWTEEEVEEIGNRMALADPMAEILMDLTCPECGHRSNKALDLVAFLWSEIEARAKRLLWEIHALASAYGWPERDILALSDHRRRLYLEMVQA